MDSIYKVLTNNVNSITSVVDKAEAELKEAISEYIREGQSLKSKRGLTFIMGGMFLLIFEIFIENGELIIGFNFQQDGLICPHATHKINFSKLSIGDKVQFLDRAKVGFAELKPIDKEDYYLE